MENKSIALILQGGGALGAFEYGVVAELVEQGYQPKAVSGVSIGAINAAAIAGAPQGQIAKNLHDIWKAITLPEVPFLPPTMQGNLSLLGNPNFWRSRTDYLNIAHWDSYCDTKPILATLNKYCDFAQMNNPEHIRMAVTSTDLHTGGQVTFCNYMAGGKPDNAGNHKARAEVLTAEHVLASGSLPPGFPPVKIGDHHYWDGGLFSNTPIDALLNMLEPEEIDSMPIIAVDLWPTNNQPLPANLVEVQSRALAMQYQHRFWDEYGGSGELSDFLQMLDELGPLAAGKLDGNPAFAWLMRLRALKNLKIIASAPAALGGDHDFSPYGVQQRFQAGVEAARTHIAQWQPAKPVVRKVA